jgi:predicted transcriptional regulator
MNDRQQPVFAALADPMRRQLLVNLAANSPKTATVLSREYPISRQGILKHLDVLEHAGLVTVYQHGREKRYSFAPEPLSELDDFIKQIEAMWDKRLMRLKNFVENEMKDEK